MKLIYTYISNRTYAQSVGKYVSSRTMYIVSLDVVDNHHTAKHQPARGNICRAVWLGSISAHVELIVLMEPFVRSIRPDPNDETIYIYIYTHHNTYTLYTIELIAPRNKWSSQVWWWCGVLSRSMCGSRGGGCDGAIAPPFEASIFLYMLI